MERWYDGIDMLTKQNDCFTVFGPDRVSKMWYKMLEKWRTFVWAEYDTNNTIKVFWKNVQDSILNDDDNDIESNEQR